MLLPHDYVNFVLTGAKSMEPGDASGTGFFDVENLTFSDQAMAGAGDAEGARESFEHALLLTPNDGAALAGLAALGND